MSGCDTQFWVIAPQGGWPMVVCTTDSVIEAHAAVGYLNGEMIDRHAQPLPKYEPEVVA